MGCTCQTPTCAVPRLTLWVLIIVSKYQIGRSDGATLPRWESARDCGSQPDCAHIWVRRVNLKSKRILSRWPVHVLYMFQCGADTENIDFFFHSAWHSAVIQSPQLIADEERRPQQWQAGQVFFFLLFFFPHPLRLFPIGSWLNEREEMFHVALFRRPLFLSIWNSLLAQQAGHSIRCFEPACSIVSLHFLFCLPVFPEALVALISTGPSAP